MSGIAGIIHFDGRPVEHGQIEAMTAAMHYRGPDGIHHWRRGNVALGQCMLRTTPESLEETQPLTNQDESLILVMDGRVDNYEELRRELLGKGAMLRTRADAELVLRAYEVWGDDCPCHIIGECVFFIWDKRQQRLFAGRDAAGTRHFYYHQGRGWFAFASEIKALLALPQIERHLNETRLLDYLVEKFDRDDEVGTFYQGILRMPAGHAMSVTTTGPCIWRWWCPGELSEQRFNSLDECTEAFMAQLGEAVECRLRSIKPVGAMLSGGLDSSSIVGLISNKYREKLPTPLQTFSFIQDDRGSCPDWQSINEILLSDTWLQPTVLTSTKVNEVWQSVLSKSEATDEPFAYSHGFTYDLTYEAARAAGCGVLLDGIAGDLLFYSPSHTGVELVRHKRLRQIPRFLTAYRNHGLRGGYKQLVNAAMGRLAPDAIRGFMRRYRDKSRLSERSMSILQSGVAGPYLASKRSAAYYAGNRLLEKSDQMSHSLNFTTGLLSFGHETYGSLAFSHGIEPRSPFSDRRMIEFAIRMPIAAKLALPCYKHVLRFGTQGLLPDVVRWRSGIGMHPGWKFYDRLASNIAEGVPSLWESAHTSKTLEKWVIPAKIHEIRTRYSQSGDVDSGQQAFCLLILSQWMASRKWTERG